MRVDPIGLYVHIPFCLKKCNYCDFCSFASLSYAHRDAYLCALCREIERRSDLSQRVDTVFFGGGTPSLLSPDEFEKVNETLHKSFQIDDDAEFTVECNPKTLTKEKLDAMRRGGVNRISIGVQSASDGELAALGRVHTYDDFCRSFDLTVASGFSHVSVDLMYGIPGQTPDSFRRTLGAILSLPVEHVSTYGLILEEGTPFGDHPERLSLPGEEEELSMYRDACDTLCRAGFEHYEISNFARPGARCRHNLHYWNNDRYFGFGVSAYSFDGRSRFGSGRDLDAYISGQDIPDSDVLSPADLAFEYGMLSLRTSDGLSFARYRAFGGTDFLTAERRAKLSEYASRGLVLLRPDGFSLTEDGFYVSNTLMSELL